MNLWAGILKFFLQGEKEWREAKSSNHCRKAATISQDQGLLPGPFYDLGGVPVPQIFTHKCEGFCFSGHDQKVALPNGHWDCLCSPKGTRA